MKYTPSAELLAELAAPRRDMSDVIARIDIACIALEIHEPGQWWDFERRRRRLEHPAIAQWMQFYDFASLSDLPPAALIAFSASLNRRLDAIARGLPHAQ